MNWDARLGSTAALRAMYRKGHLLLQEYKDKTLILEAQRYPVNELRKVNDLRHYKRMIEYHTHRCHMARLELILRNKPVGSFYA